jgi:hypothetical protein
MTKERWDSLLWLLILIFILAMVSIGLFSQFGCSLFGGNDSTIKPETVSKLQNELDTAKKDIDKSKKVYEGTGNQDIFLHSGGDETLTAEYGGWELVCDGTHWYEANH